MLRVLVGVADGAGACAATEAPSEFTLDPRRVFAIVAGRRGNGIFRDRNRRCHVLRFTGTPHRVHCGDWRSRHDFSKSARPKGSRQLQIGPCRGPLPMHKHRHGQGCGEHHRPGGFLRDEILHAQNSQAGPHCRAANSARNAPSSKEVKNAVLISCPPCCEAAFRRPAFARLRQCAPRDAAIRACPELLSPPCRPAALPPSPRKTSPQCA